MAKSSIWANSPDSRVPASSSPLRSRLLLSICNEMPEMQLTLKMFQLNFWSSTQNSTMDFFILTDRKSIFPGSQAKDMEMSLAPLFLSHQSITNPILQSMSRASYHPHCYHPGPSHLWFLQQAPSCCQSLLLLSLSTWPEQSFQNVSQFLSFPCWNAPKASDLTKGKTQGHHFLFSDFYLTIFVSIAHFVPLLIRDYQNRWRNSSQPQKKKKKNVISFLHDKKTFLDSSRSAFSKLTWPWNIFKL